MVRNSLPFGKGVPERIATGVPNANISKLSAEAVVSPKDKEIICTSMGLDLKAACNYRADGRMEK